MKRQQEQQQVLMLVLTLCSSCQLQTVGSAPSGGGGGAGGTGAGRQAAGASALAESRAGGDSASSSAPLQAAPLQAAPLRNLDKRSWTPRASRVSEEEARAVGQLLEELATLDIGAAASRSQQQQQQQQMFQEQQAALPLGRLRGRSTFPASQPAGGSQNIVAPEGEAAFRSRGGGGGAGGLQASAGGANYPKRTAVSNRHMPCFFNAITCF